MYKITIIKFISLLIMIAVVFCDTTNHAKTIKSISSELKHAETWYWMARATNNSLDYHNYSQKHYKNVKELALTLPNSIQEPWLSTSKAGINQSEWRKINAWNNFRNIFPAVWWLIGDDPTLEFKDEDHLMLALSNCWEQLEPGFGGLGYLSKIFVVPRCNDSVEFEQSTDCGEIKDEFLNTMDQLPRFLGVRDDAISLAMGPEWIDFISNTDLPISSGRKLGKLLQTNILLIVDIIPIDEMEDPFPAGRIDIQYYLWNLDDDSIIARGNDSGTVITLVGRRWMFSAWSMALLIFVLLYATYRTTMSKLPDIELKGQLIIAGGAFVAGYILSYYAGQISNIFVPEFGDMALDTANYLPVIEMALWPLVHGALVMIGPLILCAFLFSRFQPQIKLISGSSIDIRTVLPSIQAGVLASLFAPIVLAWHGEGIELALVLSVAAMCMSSAIAPSVEVILGQATGEPDRSPYTAMLIGIAGLLILIPLGFFRPEWLNGLTHWYSCIIVLILAAVTWHYRPKFSDIIQSVEEHPTADLMGSIRHPIWVSDNSREFSDILSEINNPGIHSYLIGGEAGIGKSRLIEELRRNLSGGDWIMGYSSSEKPINMDSAQVEVCENSEPFSIISQAFGPALGIANLAQRQATLEKASDTFAGFESSLSEFPGVGMLFEIPESDTPVVTKDQLIQDVILAVRQKAQDNKLVFFLDDLQWADESSIELIKRMISYFRQHGTINNPVVIILSARKSSNIDILFTDSNYTDRIIYPEEFAEDKITEFLNNAGLSVIPGDFPSEVLSYLGTGYPQHILEFLRGLITAGQAEEDEEGTLSLIPGFTKDAWEKAVPKELHDQINHRLDALNEKELLLLECAAQIGRKFSISGLAAGTNMDRLDVLGELRKLEKNTHIVIDIDESDDQYQLESQVLRDVLKNRLKKEVGVDTPELIKEMHYRIAMHMTANEAEYSPHQILTHCLIAGRRLNGESLEYGEKAINASVGKFAWPEVLKSIKVIENANVMATAPEKLKDKLHFAKAQALRGIGGQENRDEARCLLLNLTASLYLDSYETLFTWLETIYEEKQKSELEEMISTIDSWHKNTQFSDGLVSILTHFYACIGANILAGNDFDRDKYQNNLKSLRDELNASTNNEAEEVTRKRLLSMIIQETALDLTRRGKDSAQHEDEINRLLDESLQLKQDCNDLPGIAINLGSRGSFYLYTLNDPVNARDYLKQDMDIVVRMGDEGARTGLLNKLAMCDWIEAENAKDTAQANNLKESAFDLANESYQNAIYLGREIDAVFAALNIFSYGGDSEGHNKIINAVGKEIDNKKLWNEITSPYIKSEMLKALEKLADTKGRGWVKTLRKKLA